MNKVSIKHIVSILVLTLTVGCLPNKSKITIDELRSEIISQTELIDGNIAVAFRDPTSADRIILINANEKFHAASTMKTPVMIEIYNQFELGKFKLTDSIMVINEFKSIVDGSNYSMDIAIDGGEGLYGKIGQMSTIYDLMYDMITVSSNLATNILIQLVNAESVTATMRKLGADQIEVLRGVEDQKAYDLGLSNSTTANDLMLIMQAIAEGRAGAKADCQQMIEILKDQKFNDMIPLLLPKSVEVAHKTGSITGVHHDSAIVYLPDGRYYILVLLSKNLGDFEKITRQMAEISKSVYDFMVQ